MRVVRCRGLRAVVEFSVDDGEEWVDVLVWKFELVSDRLLNLVCTL